MFMLKLYNTLTRKLTVFKSLRDKRVSIYTCGPTVYHYAHIGNLRSYVFADVLNRVLKYNGYKVKHLMNITDIGQLVSNADEGEDKMMAALKREGLEMTAASMLNIAAKYTEVFQKDLELLNIQIPDVWAKATDNIPEQIAFIERLEKNGFTYATSDGVYFDTSKLPEYGALAKLDIAGLEAGKRVAAGEKRNKTDFALWKFSSGEKGERLMEWESPWGMGFPGWHIECSAMSTKYLGERFDIHTGGVDHIPVHHTNERAQNIGAFGHPVVKFWLHNEWVVTKEGEKMSKSKENFLTLDALIDKGFSPLAYRYFLLSAHYRKPVEWSFEALRGAENALRNVYDRMRNLDGKKGIRITKNPKVVSYEKDFRSAINEDLNTPQALAIVWEIIKDGDLSRGEKKKLVFRFDRVLGLGIREKVKEKIMIPKKVLKMAEERERVRQEKNWSESDRLRDEITRLGYAVEDTAEGPKVKKSM